MHSYPRVPHTADIIQSLRTLDGQGQPVFLSEYGIGSAVDLWRAVRHFEQRGAEGLEDAQFFRDKLEPLPGRLASSGAWTRPSPGPEDFFMESLRKMAGQRTLGLNAIRSNPNIVSHSLTGAIDHVMCGEGLTTLFRELKPGTIDALYDAWAPLRWCLFAEPVHVDRGGKIRLEAVLANEDVLAPGEYPARFQVVGPESDARPGSHASPSRSRSEPAAQEPPLATTCFAEDVAIDGPAGKYRFLATFERGAAAAGGDDRVLRDRPGRHAAGRDGSRPLGRRPGAGPMAGRARHSHAALLAVAAAAGDQREVILASAKPPAPGGAAAFAELARRIASGSTVVFLSPEVFAHGDQPTAWLPLGAEGHAVADSRLALPEGRMGQASSDLRGPALRRPDGLHLLSRDHSRPRLAGPGSAGRSRGRGDQGLAGLRLGPDGGGLHVWARAASCSTRCGSARTSAAIRPPSGCCGIMLRYASADADKPPANLPPDFDRQLQALGLGTP